MHLSQKGEFTRLNGGGGPPKIWSTLTKNTTEFVGRFAVGRTKYLERSSPDFARGKRKRTKHTTDMTVCGSLSNYLRRATTAGRRYSLGTITSELRTIRIKSQQQPLRDTGRVDTMTRHPVRNSDRDFRAPSGDATRNESFQRFF